MGQRLRIARPKRNKPKGIWISKKSIGTIWINGRPYSYNLNKMSSYRLPPDKESKKKVIYIRRK